MKRSLKIADLTPGGGLAFDLVDIVALLGDRALKSRWMARDVWTVQGGGDDQFENMCKQNVPIPGEQFSNALKKVVQIIDGRFEASDGDCKEPWAIVEAIDSSYFVLHAEPDVLSQARAIFRAVSDYPDEKSA